MTEREHLLVIIVEECNEIAQRATKALRFGLDEIQPVETGGDGATSNRERLSQEVDDLLGALKMLHVEYDNGERTAAKMFKILHFLNYSREQGTLQ